MHEIIEQCFFALIFIVSTVLVGCAVGGSVIFILTGGTPDLPKTDFSIEFGYYSVGIAIGGIFNTAVRFYTNKIEDLENV